MEMLIVGLFILSLFLFIYSMNRYKKFKLLSQDEIGKYRKISKKEKLERSEDEQEFYIQTQESFYCLMGAKYSFIFAVFLLVIYIIMK